MLLVEDEPSVGELVRGYLTRDGYRVIWVRSGEEALAELERHPVRLVLLDIGLPGKDGFALLREIRSSPYGTVRVIALTAHAMTGDRERALQAGFDGYITKPIDVRNFPDQVQRALQGEQLNG